MVDTETSEFVNFIDAVGRLTISWATLEFGLDLCTIGVHRFHNGRKIEPELPRALQRKLRYLKKAFEVLPAMAQYRANFLSLIDKIDVASDKRHDMIHGVVRETVSEGVKMTRLLRHTEPYQQRDFTVTPVEILREANNVNKLANYALRTGLALNGIDPDTGERI